MKKRFGLLSLSLLIAPVMIYSMDSNEEVPESPLVMYAKANNLLHGVPEFEQKLEIEEARLQREDYAKYARLIGMAYPTEENVAFLDADDQRERMKQTVMMQAILMMLATGVTDEAKEKLAQKYNEVAGKYEKALKREKRCKKQVRRLESRLEQFVLASAQVAEPEDEAKEVQCQKAPEKQEATVKKPRTETRSVASFPLTSQDIKERERNGKKRSKKIALKKASE